MISTELADNSMVEMTRVYWSRHALRLAYAAVVMWLGASALLAFMPKEHVAGNAVPSSPAEVLRTMFDGVLAAVIWPGVCLVILAIVAAVIHGRNIRRRDPVRRFSRQQRREGIARAAGLCEIEVGLGRR